MVSILQYPFITPYSHVQYAIGINSCPHDALHSPLFQWLLNGKVAENPVITPTDKQQIVRPSSVNRYLESVVVEPIPITPAP